MRGLAGVVLVVDDGSGRHKDVRNIPHDLLADEPEAAHFSPPPP